MFKISKSGYYNWLGRGPSKRGHRVSRPRVARAMRVNNLFARRKRKFKITTNSEHNYP